MGNILSRKYDYRRRLPHFQNPGTALFATFCKLIREPFSEAARNVILRHCIYDHGRRFDLHAAVVMPDHVHLLWKTQASLAGRIFRSCLTVRRKLRGQIRVHPPEPRAEGFSCPTRRLSVALDKEKVERGSAFGLEIFMTEVGDRGCDQGDGKTFARKDIVQRKH